MRQAALAIGLLLALWQGAVVAFALPPFILPGPARVAVALWDSRALIAEHALITAWEVALGLVIGGGLGTLVAVGLALSRAARVVLQPLLVASQALPVFALAPILTLWLGFGIESKIVMAVLIIFFPVAAAFLDGLMRTHQGWLDLAQTMGARPIRYLWVVRLPAALPSLASGLKLGAVYAPIGAVIGEWVGAAGGLGYLMLLANGRAKIDLMFAAVLVLAAMTVCLHWAVGRAAAALLRRFDGAAT